MRIIDVTLNGKTLCFSDGTTREASAKECSYFKRRKKLIAYPIKVKDEDGSPVLAEDGTPKERYEIIRWADIHRHSWYSLLDGCTSIKNMVSHTEGAGGITDHGVMCGVMQFYAEMKKAEKIPIVGQEFYCETINGEKKGNHLILLAKNETGYKNLVKLSSMAYDNFYYKPHISYEMLEAHHEGVICSSACIGGEIPQLFLSAEKNPEDAEEYIAKANVVIAWFRRVFGDDFYLEVQRHGIADEDLVMPKIIQYARENNIHMIATTDSHYVNKEDHEAHDVLLCIATGKTFADEKRMKFEGTGYHLHTADEVEDLFFDIPGALDNTLEIVKKCADFHITTGKYYLPKYPVPDGYEGEYSYLDKLAHDGFKMRYAGIRRTKKWQEYSERLEYELSVIKKMGFAGYFLIVWDFLNFAHENGIPTGPGRGSGAGSIVLYSLQITDIDPMKYGLLFERFLNPSRISMPDIDSDISEKQREKVIQYVTQRYGSDHVAHIVTFGTLAAKSALRDTAKVFGLTPAEAQKISNMVPDGPKVTIEDALGENPEFRLFSQSTEINRKIVSVAKTLEGTPRNLSTHACGIVISQDAVTEYVPELITRDKVTQEATLSTQYNMTECEDAGTLKMDFLGLRTLDVIDSTLKQIKRNHPEIQWTTNTIPFTTPKIYKFLGSGKTDGVFQLESPGMRKLLKDMYKDVRSRTDTEEKGEEYFERLIAVVALYRPGPMDEIPNYIKAMKSGNVHYDHPKLKNILSNTYGVLVYQEQIMFAVRELAGFSAADADKVRKAMGKKKLDIMEEYGEYFLHGSEEHDKRNPDHAYHIAGCVKNGIPEETARIIWDKMVKFAAYAFNKSHAACYAAIAARTALLSSQYPIEFLTGMLNSYLGNAPKLSQYVKVCHERGVKLLCPDVNSSGVEFQIEKDGRALNIRFGLSGIKNVGNVAATNIVAERDANGVFTSLENFIERMALQKMDCSTLKALICTGALDCFGGTRAGKLAAYDDMLRIIADVKKRNKNQISFFEMDEIAEESKIAVNIPDVPEMSLKEQAKNELEYLGFYINHPITQYQNRLKRWEEKGMLTPIADCEAKLEEKNYIPIRVAGLVEEKTLRTSMKNDRQTRFLTFKISDGINGLKCIVFKDKALEITEQCNDGDVVYILGTLKKDDFGMSCIVEKLCCLEPDAPTE